MAISKRFPEFSQIAAVYAVIVMVIYTWTIMWFFWRVPSWLYFLNIWEIVKIFAYSIATDLLETLVVLALPVTLAVILPPKWFREGFVARSVLMVLSGLGYLIYLAYQFHDTEFYPTDAIRLALAVPLLMLVVVYLAGKNSILRKIIEFIADRATVFLYITTPISLFCLLVVLIQLFI